MRSPEALPVHGGNLDAVARRFGVERATLIDFSANVNPAGPPHEVRVAIEAAAHGDGILDYPEPTGFALRERIAAHLGIDTNQIAVGNGASALLDATIGAFAPSRALLPVPAFSEYRRALRARRVEIDTCPFDAATIAQAVDSGNADLLILNNPHNPTGTLLERAEVERLIECCERRGIAILIDEAFIDYAPDASVLNRALAYDGAIVVRSLTKFYGMPGVRVGYLAANRADAVRTVLPSWPVGAVDIAAATAALDASEYARMSLAVNTAARSLLAYELGHINVSVLPSSTNFLCVELPCDPAVMDQVIARLVQDFGIVVRDCRDYDGFERRCVIRVAVLGAAENERLVTALRTLLPHVTRNYA